MDQPIINAADSQNLAQSTALAAAGGADTKPTNEQILNQEEEILKDQKSALPVSAKIPIQNLLDEQHDNETMRAKFLHLYLYNLTHVHCSRRDGNCFYRSLLFSLARCIIDLYHQVSLQHALMYLERVNSTLQHSYTYILSRGQDEIVVEDPYTALKGIMDQVGRFIRDENTDKSESGVESFLLATFNNEELSSQQVWQLRMWTACQLREKQSEQDFLVDQGVQVDFEDFVKKEVESMGSEADTLHIGVIKDLLQVNIHIWYVDTSSNYKQFKDVLSSQSQKQQGHEYLDIIINDEQIHQDVRTNIQEQLNEQRNNVDRNILVSNVQEFNYLENDDNVIKLLYRPGHYDIIM